MGIMRMYDTLVDQRDHYGDRARLLEPREGGVLPGSWMKVTPDEVLTNALVLRGQSQL